MTSLRSTRSKSTVAEPSDAATDESIWRRIFATFLADASSALVSHSAPRASHSYFYLLQSDGRNSMCLLTGLDCETYSALLLKCRLISIRNNKNGSRSVHTSNEKWKEFLHSYHLRGNIGEDDDHAEYTTGYIFTSAFDADAGAIGKSDNTTTSGRGKNMAMVRVGKIRLEDPPPLCTAINRGLYPPRMNAGLRQAKIKLNESLRCNELMDYTDVSEMTDVYTVYDWVLMKTGMAASNTSTKQKIDGDDSDDDDEMIRQITPPQTVQSPLAPPQKTPFTQCQIPRAVSTITPDEPNLSSQPSILDSTISTNFIRKNIKEKPTVSDDIRKQFPALSQYYPEVFHRERNVVGEIDLDFQLLQSIIAESAALCKMKGEPFQVMHSNGVHGTRFIELPITLSKDRTSVRSNINRFIDEQLIPAININTEKEKANDDITEVLLDYLTDKSRRGRLMEKLREMRLVPKVMNEFEVGALLDKSGIKVRQWRIIRQCLKLFMDVQVVSVPERLIRELGTDHGLITHGTYLYADPDKPNRVKEKVHYWTKDPVYEFLQSVQSLINGYSLQPDDIKDISVIHGGDHGKQKFRFASKVIVRMKDATYSQVFGLADVACRKDYGDILDNSCMPLLIPGINEIYESKILFSLSSNGDNTKATIFSLELVKKDDEHTGTMSISPMSYMAGDLSYLSFMMGKENFSSQWCNWCRSSKSDWQTGRPILDVEMWDIETIKAQVLNIRSNKLTGTAMLGVRRSPLLKIPFNNIIFAGLHAGIGIGNMITDYLEEFVDIEVEHLSDEEFRTRQTKRDTERDIQELREEKEIWIESPDGGKLLNSVRDKLRRVERDMKKMDNNDARLTDLFAQKNAYEAKCHELVNSRNIYSNAISSKEKEIKAAKDKLEAFTKERRRGEESVYTSIDRIFQKHGANRAHYFGRAFEGVDIRKIMNKSDELFGVGGDIRVALLESENALDDTVLANKINTTCDDVCLVLKLWDGAFSAIHADDPTPEHCDVTQQRINKAMAQCRKMGMSITPKLHGMEMHVVNQMRTIPGGIGKHMEHWIEQYHQIGYRFDVAYCRVGSLKGQAAIRSSVEKRGRNPLVQMNKKKLEEAFTRRKRKKSKRDLEHEAKRQVKEEKREIAFLLEDLNLPADSDLTKVREDLECDDELVEMEELLELEKQLFDEGSNGDNMCA